MYPAPDEGQPETSQISPETHRPVVLTATQATGQMEKRIYYVRDGAGLSNVRLQFEVMVAITAVSNRVLMIPPASHMDHVERFIQETDVWSPGELSKTIKFQYATQAGPHWCPSGAFQIDKRIEALQPGELPEDRDWCFGSRESRIANFECLHMFTPQTQAVATTAVFNGLQIQDRYIQEAKGLLSRMKLVPGHFVAAHLRRGDFTGDMQGYGPHFSPWAMETVYPTLNQFASNQPLLICTDETNPAFWQQIRAHVNAASLHGSFELADRQLTLDGAIIDMLACSMAGTFLGTPGSTFSQSINQLRLKIQFCKKAPKKRSALALTSQKANVRLTRWFDTSRLQTYHKKDDPRDGCVYSPVDFDHVTQFSAMNYNQPAVCQLDVQ